MPLELFSVPDGLEVTLWAETPMLRNPTNIDIDRDGRIWVAEGVRYRTHHARQPEGDRIVVLEDTDGDGKADKQWTFVQEADLVAPLGVAVIDNKIVVSQPPDLIVYTDVDRNLRFDPAVDKREVLLTGFQGKNHDHSLHSVTVGPDGKWIFNSGNTGGMFTDKSGKTFRVFGAYRDGPVGPFKNPHNPAEWAGKPSDDGHVYVGGFTVRMNPDGTNAEIIGHNYRNSYEQSVTSLGDVFQNDNDDPPACRVSWVMEYANFGFSSNDGQRTWQADRRPGQSMPVGRVAAGRPGHDAGGRRLRRRLADRQRVLRERRARRGVGRHVLRGRGRPQRGLLLPAEARPARASSSTGKIFLTSNKEQKYAGSDFIGGGGSVTGAVATLFRPSDVAVGPDGAIYVSDWIDARVGGHQDLDDETSGAIYRIAPKGFVSKAPAFDAKTIDGLITALRSPAVNVRAIGFEGLKARGAAAVSPVAALLERSEPVHPRPRDLPAVSARSRGPEARRHARVADRSGDADRGLPRHAARRPGRAAGRGEAGEGQGSPASAARWRCRCATSRRTRRSTSWSTSRAATTARIAATSKRGAPARRRRRRRSTSGCARRSARRRSAGLVADVRAARVAPARAGGGAGPAARARSRRSCPLADRRLAMDAHRVHRRSGGVEGDARRSPSRTARCSEPATWWLLNRMSNNWADHDLRPALKAAGIYDPDTITLREAVVPRPGANLPELSVERDRQADRRRGARQGNGRRAA